MKEKRRKLSKKIIVCIVCAVLCWIIVFVGAGLQIAFVIADKIESWRPDYEKIDISAILEKDELTGDDYAVLYRQTGLTKSGINRALDRGYTGIQRILDIQNDYFAERTVINDIFVPLACQDKISKPVNYVYLEDGDILVSSSTHISGWRAGHSGLVTDANAGRILQASTIGDTSSYGSMADFNTRVNFMILSPKVDAEKKAEVVDYAKENLVGKVYDPTAGVFSNKNNPNRTQCSHLVWSAYNKFGTDLDSDGGLVVTPQDLANSPYVEIVQVFGFDPIKLWK